MIYIQLLFWVCTALVFHSYVVFPFLLGRQAKYCPDVIPVEPYEPEVIILLAVYNAKHVIEEKIKSVLQNEYPVQKIHFLVGSDCSDDGTNEILEKLSGVYPQLHVTYFKQRTGKIGIINDLLEQAHAIGIENRIIVSTDVAALFDPKCLRFLVRRFVDPSVTIVGANIIKRKSRADGISGQEKAYYGRELMMKHEEGKLWGAAIGVFGACFAIRPEAFAKVPSHFLVDDFYITMKVLENGGKVLYDMDACVYMNLANDSSVEFKRKVRIAAGNFQNLSRFMAILFRFNGLAYAFLSHKVLRWLSPFFMLITLFTSIILYPQHPIYQLATWVQVALFLSPLYNYLFERLNLHISLLKFAAHFYYMNLGILFGFFKYLGGIKTSVWEPTKR